MNQFGNQEYNWDRLNLKLLTTLGVLLLMVYGCKQNSTGSEPEMPETGTVEVVVMTSGFDLDRDGYSLDIDSEKTLGSSINDTLLFRDVEEGSRQLGIEGLDNECTVSDSNPVSIAVAAEDTVQTTIKIECKNVVLRNKIVYEYDGLYIMDSDGSNLKQLTSNSWDSEPVVSPDGTKVAFVNGRRNPDVSEHHNEIYIVDASGYPITHIPRPPESLHDQDPSWSPDGKKLIFSQSNQNSNGNDIVSVNADGTGRKKITDDRPDDAWPLYTPDGSKIVFYSLNRGGDSQIFIMDADGSNITRLTDNDFFTHHLELSNDGSMVAFEVQGEPQQIYVMNIDGTGIRPVTKSSDSFAFASWSPDDTQLIFYNFNASDIFRINLDGTGLSNVSNTLSINESDPNWSPVE